MIVHMNKDNSAKSVYGYQQVHIHTDVEKVLSNRCHDDIASFSHKAISKQLTKTLVEKIPCPVYYGSASGHDDFVENICVFVFFG